MESRTMKVGGKNFILFQLPRRRLIDSNCLVYSRPQRRVLVANTQLDVKAVKTGLSSRQRQGFSVEFNSNSETHEYNGEVTELVSEQHLIMGKELGRGSVATVFRSVYVGPNVPNLRYGQIVAVKQLHEERPSQRTIAAFENEMKVTLSLPKHPNIVQYLSSTISWEEFDNSLGTRPLISRPTLMLVSELVGAPKAPLSLYRALKSSRIPLDRRSLAVDICRGLTYVHEQGIAHRDVKSLNVVLDLDLKTGRLGAKLCDFGSAAYMEESVPFLPKTNILDIRQMLANSLRSLPLQLSPFPTISGNETGGKSSAETGWFPVGSLLWMAPEHLEPLVEDSPLIQDPDFQGKCDVYSFGIVLWEILERRIPWCRGNNFSREEVIRSVVDNNERLPISDWVHPRIKTLLSKCWEKNPLRRPRMREVLRALENIPINEWDIDGRLGEEQRCASSYFNLMAARALSTSACVRLPGGNVEILGNSTTIGRSSYCEIGIVDRRISRQHCRIERMTERSNEYLITDTGSRNGTFINGRQLDKGMWALLSEGDEITLGKGFRVNFCFTENKLVFESECQPDQDVHSFLVNFVGTDGSNDVSHVYLSTMFSAGTNKVYSSSAHRIQPMEREDILMDRVVEIGPHDGTPSLSLQDIISLPNPKEIVGRLEFNDGRILELGDGFVVTLGRDPACTVVIDDNNIAQEQAEIRHVGEIFVLCAIADSRAGNPIELNGEDLHSNIHSMVRLHDEDKISFSSCEIVFRCR